MQTKGNELNFEGQDIYVGLDVHLKSWTACIRTAHLEHKRLRLPPNAEALYGYLKRNFPGGAYHSAYEAGFCGFWAHRQLEKLGIDNIVTNAADVPTGQKERVQKDDPVDSGKIARALCAGHLEAIHVPLDATLEERALVRMRATMAKDMARIKARVKAFLYFFGISYPERFSKSTCHWSRNFMRWLSEEVHLSQDSGNQVLTFLLQTVEEQRALLLSVTRKIKTLSETEKYAANVELLKSVPGVGLITAITLLTEMETVERFADTDHLAAYFGLVPKRNCSGEKMNDGEMTFRGQKILKKCIIEAAWVAARIDPALLLAYNRYKERMVPNKAIVRIARKLVNRIYFVLKNKRKYTTCVVK